MIDGIGSRPMRPPSRRTERRGDLLLVMGVPVSAGLVLVGAVPSAMQLIAKLFRLVVLAVVVVSAWHIWPEAIKLHESLLYSLALVLLALAVGGLAIHELLPFLGVAGPLDRVPVVSLMSAVACLGLWRARRWRLHDGPSAAKWGCFVTGRDVQRELGSVSRC